MAPATSRRRSKKSPSSETDAYWIEAEGQKRTYPPHTERGGKWLLFLPRSGVDEAWGKVVAALGEGKLGDYAKVSTARGNPNAPDPKDHVICVYTYDSDDVEDVKRIRDALREIGFVARIPYKTDHATLKGEYKVRGRTRISKYYE